MCGQLDALSLTPLLSIVRLQHAERLSQTPRKEPPKRPDMPLGTYATKGSGLMVRGCADLRASPVRG
jgi:hypothetical protein